jgi:hypothetical protein
MKTEKEIRTAWEIWILINRLNDLLWDRYDDEFIEIDLQEEVDKPQPREEKSLLPVRRTQTGGAIEPLNLTTPQDKTKG